MEKGAVRAVIGHTSFLSRCLLYRKDAFAIQFKVDAAISFCTRHFPADGST